LPAAEPWPPFRRPVHFLGDPATLIAAFSRVAGNQGSLPPGVDGLTVADVEESIGRWFPGQPAGQPPAGAFRRLSAVTGGGKRPRQIGAPAPVSGRKVAGLEC